MRSAPVVTQLSNRTLLADTMPSSDSYDLRPSKVVRTGSCLCKSVNYELTGDPVSFRICHCQNCRRATGSAFMASLFFKGTVSSTAHPRCFQWHHISPLTTYTQQVCVTSGAEKLKVFADSDTASGARIDRYFCTECGSNVFLRPTNKRALELDYKIVSYGTLNEEVDWSKSFPAAPPIILLTVPQTEMWQEYRSSFVKGIEIRQPKDTVCYDPNACSPA